jgi:hypothetical protein
MNHYAARQIDPKADRPDAGKWRYTLANDGVIYAVGNCAHDCPGHDTPEEAYEHQRQYELDRARFYGPTSAEEEAAELETPGQNEKCEVCGKTCRGFGEAGPGMMRQHFLCFEHRNRDGLAQVFKIGESWSSY